MQQHEQQCECERCKFGDTFVEAQEARFMQEFGWYAHMVLDDTDCPNNVNFHTHGIEEKFGHLDFQLCVPLHPSVVMGTFHLLVDKIKTGEQFGPGKIYENIAANGYGTQFVLAKECGRTVLRMCIPNRQNTYEGGIYAAQFTMLDHTGVNY